MQGIQAIRLLLPFLLALVIAYLVKRPVAFLERKGMRRSLAIFLVYFLLVVVVALGIILIAPGFYRDIMEMMEVLPAVYEKYKSLIDKVIAFFSVEQAVLVLENSIGLLADCLLSFVLAFYLVRDREQIKNFVLAFFPVSVRKDAAEGLHEVSRIISAFVMGQVVVAVLVGILETIALLFIGAKYAFLLGFVGGISNIIPVVGPFIGAVPAVALALLESPYQALITAGVFLAVQQLDNNLLTPRIVEGRLGLHPMVTLSVVFVAGLFWGIGGVLLSIPITAVVVSIIKRIYLVKIRSKTQ